MSNRLFGNCRLTLLRWVVAIFPIAFLASVEATEIRTYEFIAGDEYTYKSDCGQCALVLGFRARVSGQFSVALDLASGTGVLQSVDITLKDFEILTRRLGGGAEWLPSAERPFLDGSSIFDAFRPPLAGILEIDNGRIELSPNGANTLPSNIVVPPENFRVVMTGNEASFNYFLPIIELIPSITNARARMVSVIPEPGGILLFGCGIILFNYVRRV